MTTSFYFADPDGNSVELQYDNFRGDWAQSAEWMRTAPEFAANPIGTPIDPDQLVAARRAGLSADEIHGPTPASTRPTRRWTCGFPDA